MIRFGPAGAPRWFDLRLDRLDAYLEHIVSHGASSIEYVVHGGSPGMEIERVHLSQPNFAPAVAAAHRRGLAVHLHAPLTSEYRISNWPAEPDSLQAKFAPIVELLVQIGRGQQSPPVLVIHSASFPDNGHSHGSHVTRAFVAWLLESLQRHGSGASVAIELRLPADAGDDRFDRSLETLAQFVASFGSPAVGICWDVANYLGGSHNRSMPSRELMSHVNHVHLHDRHIAGGFHAPLGLGQLPWRAAIEHLKGIGWSGAVTLEIRYRYALEAGEPWEVLAASLEHVRQVLTEE